MSVLSEEGGALAYQTSLRRAIHGGKICERYGLPDDCR